MNITDQITTHFSAAELTRGSGVPEDAAIQRNIVRLATTLLEPARMDWERHVVEDNLGGSPIWKVICGYRSPGENARVNGAKASQHMLGCAADVACDVDWPALREGRGAARDAARMQAFAIFLERWARGGSLVGGLGIYTEKVTGQLYWVHLDIRPRFAGPMTVWAGHHVGSEAPTE